MRSGLIAGTLVIAVLVATHELAPARHEVKVCNRSDRVYVEACHSMVGGTGAPACARLTAVDGCARMVWWARPASDGLCLLTLRGDDSYSEVIPLSYQWRGLRTVRIVVEYRSDGMTLLEYN